MNKLPDTIFIISTWLLVALAIIGVSSTLLELRDSFKCRSLGKTYSWDYNVCLSDKEVKESLDKKGYY